MLGVSVGVTSLLVGVKSGYTYLGLTGAALGNTQGSLLSLQTPLMRFRYCKLGII